MTSMSEGRANSKGRALVVGGGGYIGYPVISRLLLAGYDVRAMDNFVYPTRSTLAGHFFHPGFEFQGGDLCSPQDRAKALAGVDHVVVLAGLVGDPITKKYPEESGLINDVGIQDLIVETGRTPGIRRVIFVSTCSNYGLMSEGVLASEDSELRPLSLYAKSKVQAERVALEHLGSRATILRFATAFGAAPRMRFDLTVNEFARTLHSGEELVVYDADTWRPYCHVRDFARLIEMVLAADTAVVGGEVFNAGGDANNHTKRSIVGIITGLVDRGRVVYKDNGGDPRNYKVDFSKVRSRLGFEPHYTVPDGVREIVRMLDDGFWADYRDAHPFYGNYVVDYSRSRG